VTGDLVDVPPAEPYAPPPRRARGGTEIALGRVLLGGLLVVLASSAFTLLVTVLHAVRLTFAEQAPPDPEVVEAFLARLGFWFPVVLDLLFTLIAARRIALRVRRDGWLHGMLVGAAVAFLDLVAVIVLGSGSFLAWLGGLGLLVLTGGVGGLWGDRVREYRMFTR
jgi:hypothetical protein